MKDELNEMIADAIAEEEATKEAEKAAEKKTSDKDFKEMLKEQLSGVLFNKSNPDVTISLKEYTTLKLKEQDLERVLSVIIDNLELSYSKDSLKLGGDSSYTISDTIRVLYPNAYAGLLEAELERVEKEGV